jgi:hypothetical protein
LSLQEKEYRQQWSQQNHEVGKVGDDYRGKIEQGEL